MIWWIQEQEEIEESHEKKNKAADMKDEQAHKLFMQHCEKLWDELDEGKEEELEEILAFREKQARKHLEDVVAMRQELIELG